VHQAVSGPSCGEEGFEQHGAFFRRCSGRDLRPMMACGLLEEPRPMQHRATFGIIGCENEPLDARKAHRTGAHRAWLQRHEQGRSDESLISELRRACSQHQHFGVGRWIAMFENPIAVACQHFAVRRDKHSTHRHFSTKRGVPSFLERDRDVIAVVQTGNTMPSVRDVLTMRR